jgi:hypothetical protein
VQVSGVRLATTPVVMGASEPPRLELGSRPRSPFADPFEQRITSPLTVASDLLKRRVA